MNEREFTVNGKSYQVSKIDPFKQFHVVRKLAPILADLIPVVAKFKGLTPEEMKGDQFDQLAPIMNGLAKLSEADANSIILTLLGAVEVKQAAGNWAKLVRNDALMFADMELPEMLQCAGRAFMFNMQNFFAVMPQLSK